MGITTACLPCLKSLFQRFMRRLDLISTAGTTKAGYPSHVDDHPAISVRTHIEAVHQKIMHREDSPGNDEERLVDLDPKNGSVEIKSMKA
jgi:hypothetical protein